MYHVQPVLAPPFLLAFDGCPEALLAEAPRRSGSGALGFRTAPPGFQKRCLLILTMIDIAPVGIITSNAPIGIIINDALIGIIINIAPIGIIIIIIMMSTDIVIITMYHCSYYLFSDV